MYYEQVLQTQPFRYEQADYVEEYAVTDGNFCIEHG